MPGSRAQRRSAAVVEATPYDNLVCFNMYQGWRAVQEHYAAVIPDHLNPQRSYVMGLCMDQPATVSQVAAVLRIDDAAVSNLVGRMEKDGLVKRKQSPEDGRSVKIHATNHGKKVMREFERKSAALDKELYSRVSREDIAVLHKIVNAILA